MLRHPALARLRRVQLPPGLRSQYTWRRGDGSFRGACEEGLSSIEAIYHCCRWGPQPGAVHRSQPTLGCRLGGLSYCGVRPRKLLDCRGFTSTCQGRASQLAEPEARMPELTGHTASIPPPAFAGCWALLATTTKGCCDTFAEPRSCWMAGHCRTADKRHERGSGSSGQVRRQRKGSRWQQQESIVHIQGSSQ